MQSLKPVDEVNSITIMGMGTMGRGWILAMLMAGFDVSVWEIEP